MTLEQAFVTGWVQFAVASAAILLAADLVVRRFDQPVDRIRVVQLALASALALPILALASPFTLWSFAVAAPEVAQRVEADDEVESAANQNASAILAHPPAASPPFAATAIEREELDEAAAGAPVVVAPSVSESNASPANSARAESVTENSFAATPLDAWTFSAWALLIVHALAGAWFAIEFAAGRMRLHRIVRQATPADEKIAAIWRSVSQDHGENVPLLVSPVVRSPATFGVLRPCVLLPSDFAAQGDAAMRACLAHEWSHVARRDLVMWRFAWACQFLLWMQPSFWRLRSELRLSQDLIADDRSSRAGEDAIAYSELLVRFARRRGSSSLGGALTFADRRSQLSRRIAMLLEPKAALRSRCSPAFSLLSLAAAVALATTLAAVRLDAAPKEPPVVTATIAAEEPASSDEGSPADDESAAPAATEPQAGDASTDAVAADELAGRVVDEEGKPIAGVAVDAWHWHPGNETKTDADGRFSLKGFDPDRRVEVLISKEGFSPQHFAQRPLGARGWVVTLSDKSYLEGKIVGADGQPAANAEIRASFGPVEGDGVHISEVTLEGKSREDGTYRLYLSPGKYDLQVFAGAQGVYRGQAVFLKEREAKSLDVQLLPGVRFEARVVDSVTGEPVEGFLLWQWRPPHLQGRSDAEGKIVFDGLIPGPIDFNCGGGEAKKLPHGGEYYDHGPFGRWWSPDATSEFQRFRIDDRNSGWQRNFDHLAFDLSVGMEPVTIVVEQGVTVSGAVTDPDGKPVAGATVAPARTGSGNSLTGDTRYSVTTKEDGTYQVVLPASAKATYNLVAHDGDYGQWRTWANGVSEPMQTTPGQTIEHFDLRLTEPATVRGKVTFGGRPAAGKEVRAHAFDKRENRYYDPTTKTNEDGTFELKFVRPGKHYIQAEPFWLSAEDAPDGSTVVELQPGQVLEGIELVAIPDRDEVMPELAKLPFTAKVVDADGQPVANVEVALSVVGGVESQLGTLAQQIPDTAGTTTDANGVAKVDASMLALFRLNSAYLYAVDREGKRAEVALFDLMRYADLAPTAKPDPIEMKLEPATVTRIIVDAKSFENADAEPDGIQLSVTRDGMNLQMGGMKVPGVWELLLPPGKYKVGCYAIPWSDVAETEFEISAGQATHEETIKLQPSRLAQLIGKPAPEFQQIKTTGGRTPLQLAELRGKVVLLDFWGNWCGPCIAAMPNLIDLHQEFHGQGLEIVAVHDDSVETVEELDEIVAGLVKDQWNGRTLPFPVLLDGGGTTPIGDSETTTNGATTAAYGITAFPTTIVVDREGKVVGLLNAHDLKSAREKLDAILNPPRS